MISTHANIKMLFVPLVFNNEKLTGSEELFSPVFIEETRQMYDVRVCRTATADGCN